MTEGDKKARTGELEPDRSQNDSENLSASQKVLISGQFSGPLPPPAYLEHYERVLPGAAERIFDWSEQEQRQRHDFENFLAKSVTRQQERGQIFAFLIGIGALALAAFMVYAQHPGYAIVTTITAIGTLIGAVVYRRQTKPPVQDASESTGENHS